MVVWDFLDELVLRHGLSRVVDSEALSLERLDGILTDIFKEKKPEMFVVYRMKNSWLANARRSGKGVLAHSFMDGGNASGRHRDSSYGWRHRSGDSNWVGHDGR